MGERLLIDGGILNPLPLHVIERTEGDILVAADISGKDAMPIDTTYEPIDVAGRIADLEARGIDVPEGLEKQLCQLGKRVDSILQRRAKDLGRNFSFVNMLDRMSDMQIQQNTLMALQLTPPDVHAVMRQYAYNTFDFDKAEEIIEQGRIIMNKALEQYEQENQQMQN
jgi:NTE family protein